MSKARERFDGGARDQTPPPSPPALNVEVVDAHCHLDLMDGDVADNLAAAQAVGVRRIITIGIDVPTSLWCADAAAQYADVYAAVAIHPNEANGADDAALQEIARLAQLPDVVAIGETGLDFFRDTATKQQQLASFRAHIRIAKDSGKALVIHDRDAHDAVLQVLDEEGAPEHVVFHCFSGDATLAATCAERGYVMSFAGNMTFKNAEPLREALRVAPLDLLLVETDAPFLTPMPHRGQPNAPYLIPLTLRAMANVKGVDEDTLAAAIAACAQRVFRLPSATAA
ncbi:MAG: TatD family hydrolase [Mycobacteriales bacterium]